jgi:hypothetical protein
VDLPNVKIVCTAGLPETIVDALQRGGRAIQIASTEDALFVVFYDPWVTDIKLDDYKNGNILDPDRPRHEIHEKSSRRDRAPFYSVLLVKCEECL